MRTCTLRGTTWERRYQKAIRESIHLAHSRVGRSRQRYGQKSQCSESARQLRFPCSQPASQPSSAALLSKTNAPPRPTITRAALTYIITVNGLHSGSQACLYTSHGNRGKEFKAEVGRGSDGMLCFPADSTQRFKHVQSVLQWRPSFNPPRWAR